MKKGIEKVQQKPKGLQLSLLAWHKELAHTCGNIILAYTWACRGKSGIKKDEMKDWIERLGRVKTEMESFLKGNKDGR